MLWGSDELPPFNTKPLKSEIIYENSIKGCALSTTTDLIVLAP